MLMSNETLAPFLNKFDRLYRLKLCIGLITLSCATNAGGGGFGEAPTWAKNAVVYKPAPLGGVVFKSAPLG